MRHSSRKRKKTRYLSLRGRLAATPAPASPPSIHDDHDQPPPSDLFPLQPEDLHEDQLSRFFPDDESLSLHSLLGSSSSVHYEDPISPSSSSANYSNCSSSFTGGLAMAALRGREKWAAAVEDCSPLVSAASRRLSLKLDYDGILSSWNDQCPLYVDEEEANQVVPEVHHTAATLYYSPVFVEVPRSDDVAPGQWTVPDGLGSGSEEKMAEARDYREARVMRYKEKRLKRLYNKKIRYEVRKLNAEKRPRLKGRFIRRDDD